jgi:hypothetical protein
MPQFEPKIDSREFEVANAELESASATRDAASDVADITIRIWRREGSEPSGALTWDAENALVYMISDLVVASHGRAARELPAVMTAHFANARQAIVAAKRIQTSILEFLACWQGDYIGAAILVHPPAAAGFTAAVAQNALRLSEPGQIVLSGEVSRGFQEVPGIELRDVPALTTGGSEHAGLSELVWTTPEKIAQLRNSVKTGVSRKQESPPVGATMIVNAQFAARGTSNSPEPAGATGSVPAEGDRRITKPPLSDDLKKNRDTSFQEGLADFEERRSFLTRTRLILGAVAVVIVGVGIAMFYPSGGSKAPLSKPQTPASETTQTNQPQVTQHQVAPTEPTPLQPSPESPSVDLKAQPQPPVTKVAQPKATDKHPKDKDKGSQTKTDEAPPIAGYEGMTQKDIPRLLQMAKTHAGGGNYEKAETEYQVVLRLQPGNADAKEGLRRLQIARSENQ